MTDLSIIAKRPDLPVIVFVDNYEIADDCGTTAQAITSAKIGKVVSWDGRIYDDEEGFVEEYCDHCWRDGQAMNTEAKAHELWKKCAKECIVCYSRAALPPKGCEVVEDA